MRSLRNGGASERGAVMVLSSICSLAVFAMLAIVVDINVARQLTHDTSQAADAAALAGAGELSEGATFTAAVNAVKAYTKFNLEIPTEAWSGCRDADAATALGVTPYYPDAINDNECISFDHDTKPSVVRITVPVKSSNAFFAQIFGTTSMNRRASAGATVAGLPVPADECAICVLSEGDFSTMQVGSSGASVVVKDPSGANAAVQVNSPHNKALNMHTSATLQAPAVRIVGGWSGGANSVLPAPITGAPAIDDPLAFLAVPSATSPTTAPSCTSSRSNVYLRAGYYTVDAKGGSCRLWPGVYNTLNIGGNTTVYLEPGTYVFREYGIDLTGAGARLEGTGVTLYLTCTSWPSPCAPATYGSPLEGNGSGVSVALSGPTSGTYKGLTIFMDRNNRAPVKLASKDNSTTSGSIYGRSSQLSLTSSGTTTVITSLLVVDVLDISSSSGTLEIVYDRSANVSIPAKTSVLALLH